MNFKKWVKSIQTAGYNGARTVDAFAILDKYVLWEEENWFINENENICVPGISGMRFLF